MDQLDDDGSGTLEFEEFQELMSRFMTEKPEKNDLEEKFKLFDKGSKGYLLNGLCDLTQCVISIPTYNSKKTVQ